MTSRLAFDCPRGGPNDRGSVAAEFAIVAPLLLVLLFIMVTLASIFFDQQHVQSAARDAARAGSVTISDACTVAEDALSNNDIGTLTCLVIEDCSSGSVKMSLSASRSYSIPLLGDRNVTLSATSSFVCPQ
jgi:uncharacterized membrane protein